MRVGGVSAATRVWAGAGCTTALWASQVPPRPAKDSSGTRRKTNGRLALVPITCAQSVGGMACERGEARERARDASAGCKTHGDRPRHDPRAASGLTSGEGSAIRVCTR